MRRVLFAGLVGCRAVLGAEEPLPFEIDANSEVAVDAGLDTRDGGVADAQPDATPADSVAVAEVTCARLTACNQGVGALDVATCVHRYLTVVADKSKHPLGAGWACLEKAKTCAAISDCLAAATASTACAAVGSGTARICVAGSVVTCSAATHVGAELCAMDGRACVSLSATDAACVSSTDCPTTSPKCNGNKLVACTGSLDKGSDCAKLGGICVTAGGESGCAGDETTTCSGTTVTCAGSVASYCRFGRPAVVDCAVLGSSCDPTKTCAPLGTECKDADPPTCSSTSVRYCLGGKLRVIPCAALALGACKDTFSLAGASVACAP